MYSFQWPKIIYFMIYLAFSDPHRHKPEKKLKIRKKFNLEVKMASKEEDGYLRAVVTAIGFIFANLSTYSYSR